MVSKIIDHVKYNKLLDPNRETGKRKVEFLKDCGEHKKGDRRIIKIEEYLLYSERGDCKSIEGSNPETIPAFEWYEKINTLPTDIQKHREILKQYEGIPFSKASNGIHSMKWKEEQVKYSDSKYSQDINCIGRKKDRLVVEFDEVEGEPSNAEESLELSKKTLEHYGIGYIQSTHNSKNSDYLWIEFTREITEDEAKDFLAWICPEGSRIDINFCNDKKVFPVLYAKHWKYSGIRELPIEFFKGRKIDLDACKIPKQNVKVVSRVGVDGFKYETYEKMRDVKEFLISKGVNKKTGKEEFSVSVDKVADYLIKTHNFKTYFGTKTDYCFNWDGKKFDSDSRGIIKVNCEELLLNYCKRNVVDEVFEKVKRKTATSKEEFEKDDTNFINLDNGVWDIQQKKLLPHDPKYNFQYIIEVRKDNNPLNIYNCPNWLRFINETLYPEDVAVMQEWFGFLLFREYFIKKMLICEGDPDTGKSVLMDTGINFIGEKNKTGISLQKISSGSDFTKLSLKGKHLNAFDDLSSKDLNDGGAIKVATGGGYISGEEKFGEYQQFRSFAKQWFNANKCPPVKDNDDIAYFGRNMIIKFDNVPEKLDGFLRKKLWTDKEMSGILNWALEGLYRLLENGEFSYTKTPEEVKQLMESSGCPLVAFSSDVLEKEDGFVVSKDDMYKVYSEWCEEVKKPRLSKEMLGRQLTKYCPYILAEKHKERIWKNARIKGDWVKILESTQKDLNTDTSDTSKKLMSTIKKEVNSEYNMGDMIFKKVSEEPPKNLHKLCKFCGGECKISETDLSRKMKEKLNRCVNQDCLAIMDRIKIEVNK